MSLSLFRIAYAVTQRFSSGCRSTLERTQSVRWFALVASLVLVASFAVAQDDDSISRDDLAHAHAFHTHPNPGGLHGKGNIPTPHGFPLGIDTIVNFTGHFEEQGVFWNGSPHHVWEYSMIGSPPEQGGTTVIGAPVVPVTVDLRNFDGSARFVVSTPANCPFCPPSALGKIVPLIAKPDPYIALFMGSPVFAMVDYSSSPVPTQLIDAEQRAAFGNHARADWHTLFAPSLKTPRTMVLIRGTYRYALNRDASCCLAIFVAPSVFNSELFPQTVIPDNSTVIGAAELSGDITTKDFSTFFFPNTFLFVDNTLTKCCVVGYHTFDFELGDGGNGNRTRFYVMNYSSWIEPGIFLSPGNQDVITHSHETAEAVNDPFVGFDGIHNFTPFWLVSKECGDIMEVGDVLDGLPDPSYPITLGGFTYHPQNVALLPWFEFQANSSAFDGAYSYPNESALTMLSTPQPFNCGH